MDNAGSYAITATWPHDDGITQCTATVSMNLQVQPAAPLRLSNIYKKRGPVLTPGWDWRVIFGPHSDLRPIQILMRGVRRARFPTGPFRTYNAAVRSGDPNWNDGDQRFLKLPRWGLSIEADNRFLAIDGKLRSGSTHEKPVGYEVKVIQAGRQLGDIRAAGKCGIFDCVLKKLKVQR